MTHKYEVYTIRATKISLFCNIALVLIKATALLIVNSLAIAVDLGISFVGLLVSIILFYSIRLANRPADLMHNYGYGKVEHVCEAMEGVVLIGIAIAMSSQAVVFLLHPKHVHFPLIGFAACAVNLTINFVGAYFIYQMAKKSASPAIYAEAVHYRMEGVISSIIAVAFILQLLLKNAGKEMLGLYIDPLAAFIVSIFLLLPSFKLAKDSFFKLLDSSVEEDSQMEILKQLGKYITNYCEFKDLKTRTAGRHKFVEFKLVVPEDMSLKKGHENVRILEEGIKNGIPNCEVLVKMEPCKRDCTYIKNGEKCPYM